ncbi:helix-turn-helix domain-containing protein [Micromonospora sp. NPDC050417]|uniref:helix-turn-helix domain-containing protein n=1 Tax=Micromonospora sp. NPDC050417 TaxID=3364280 RepID=UPI0037AF62FC
MLVEGLCHAVRVATASPTVRQRRLANELARLRDAAGLTIEQAAKAGGISGGHLSRVERAQVRVRVPVVKSLLVSYGAGTATIDHLAEVAQQALQRGWWHQYGSISERYATYIGFETEATEIWSFDASTLPGLLQTEAYARAMLESGAARYSAEEIADRVAVRLQRQAILTRDDQPPRAWFVLDEAAIRREVGGRAILRAQLKAIAEVAELPHVDVQVLPFKVGAHPGSPGSFIVLRYDDPATDPDVVYLETMAGDLYPEGEDAIKGASLAFNRLRAMALGPDDSIAMIKQAAEES